MKEFFKEVSRGVYQRELRPEIEMSYNDFIQKVTEIRKDINLSIMARELQVQGLCEKTGYQV